MPQYLIRTLEFSTRARICSHAISGFSCHHHHHKSSSSETRYLQTGISLCADFSTKRPYRRRRCDQSSSDRFSLVPLNCSRSRSSSRCTLNDAICCQLSMRGRLGVTRGARARRLCVRLLSFSQSSSRFSFSPHHQSSLTRPLLASYPPCMRVRLAF